MLLPFVSPQNFLDPQTDKNGKPYGPVRYKEIAKEKYIKEVADHYKGQISDKLYQALYNYEVEITD